MFTCLVLYRICLSTPLLESKKKKKESDQNTRGSGNFEQWDVILLLLHIFIDQTQMKHTFLHPYCVRFFSLSFLYKCTWCSQLVLGLGRWSWFYAWLVFQAWFIGVLFPCYFFLFTFEKTLWPFLLILVDSYCITLTNKNAMLNSDITLLLRPWPPPYPFWVTFLCKNASNVFVY